MTTPREATVVSGLPVANTLPANSLILIVVNPGSNTARTKVIEAEDALPQLYSNTYVIHKRSTVVVSASQLRSLNTSPVTLVSAQGNNTVVFPHVIFGNFKVGNTLFSTSGSPDLHFYL